ncbi:protein NRT1/ PTR FAMILY 1.2-like [Pistacia vera]|uniref:protein NRT1/ PTR FAMILY 1.2-like n=1 Tax=Pistacia vera TaxID=55513 RepID=UPI001262EB5B|nr:protein NRT1/ PTR FAMILY 1.2-like [Pistacia vera]
MGSQRASASDEKKMITEPLLSDSLNPKGGLRTMPFIIANEAFERVASLGLLANMILYLSREYNMETTEASNILFIWSAVTNFTPILGAFIADSYTGRYLMVGWGSIATLLGMVLLWSTAMFEQAKPPPCEPGSSICEPPTTFQLLLLYSSFGLMSIGAGGIRSSSLAFGADQLSRGDNLKDAGILQSYFSWYYVSVTVSSMFAVTCIVYIQDNMGWKVGLGVPAVLMFLSVLSFLLASPFYIKLKAKTSLLAGIAQVFVASYNIRHMKLSSQPTDEIYHQRRGSMLLKPSENLRCFNKACIVRNPQQDLTTDGRASNPWSLCTVDQVEEVKALIKVMPLWSAGIMMAVTIAQNTFPVIQLSTMDRHITPYFEIPAGSFSIFMIITLILWIPLYDSIIIPLASKINGKPIYLTLKKRLGIGLLFSCASLAAWAIVESFRREIAIKEGFSDNPRAVVHMSSMWLLPHYVLAGLALAFNIIGQTQFYYSELPKTMSSIGSSLVGVGMSAASLVSSFIMNAVDDVTKRGGNESWVSTNINKGHYDYYYWVLAGLSMANFIYFLACSKAYGPCKEEEVDGKEEDSMSDER